MKVLNFKAIAIGAAVDIIGSMIIGMLGTTIMSIKMAGSGLSQSEVLTELSSIGTNAAYTAFALIAGFGMTIIGGYTAARFAKHDEIVNAAFVGLVGVVLGLIVDMSATPLWYNVLALLLPIPSAMLGGYIYLRIRNL
jgi:hypothetical protein